MGKIISSMLIGASFITEPLEAMRSSLVEILGFNIEMWQMILVGSRPGSHSRSHRRSLPSR